MATKRASGASAKITQQSLQTWNKWLAVFFAVQAVAILIASASHLFPVTISYLGVDALQTQAKGHTVLAAGAQHLFDINLAFVVAAFLFAAAIAHGLIATKLRAQYERDLKQGINKIRWIEYAFSAGAMMVAIGLVVGVQDLAVFCMLFGLMAVASLMGWVVEAANQPAARINHWLGCFIGSVAGGLTWLAVAIYVIGGVLYGATAPAYVWWACASTLVLFIATAVNIHLQHRKVGSWANYLYSERTFMLISVMAKTALAWQLFAGVLHP